MTETKNNLKRPPIVVVVGHVDHGKTSLLDYIRKANVAAREAGGITQSVGAYEIVHKNEKITFIDTPGHEAFSKMRVRGAAVADVAILVVAAEEGVKPQTKEAIKVLHESKTPFVVAITKIDKPTADIERVKNDLAANDVALEGYGGNVGFHGVSNKSGEGIDELLDLILLTAEMEELTYDPTANGDGVILESKKDSKRGFTISVILKDGILTNGEMQPPQMKKHCQLDQRAQSVLKQYVNSGKLSARGYHRVLKIARTIADLEASASVSYDHLCEALMYRARED